jgi:hypothetical protein
MCVVGNNICETRRTSRQSEPIRRLMFRSEGSGAHTCVYSDVPANWFLASIAMLPFEGMSDDTATGIEEGTQIGFWSAILFCECGRACCGRIRQGQCGCGQQLANSRLAPMSKKDEPKDDPPRISRGDHGASSSGGCGYLSGPRTDLASCQCRPCEPRPDEGD